MRAVEKHQIDILQTGLGERLVHLGLGAFIIDGAAGYLGGEENLLPGHAAGFLIALPQPALIPVSGSEIDLQSSASAGFASGECEKEVASLE